MDHAKKQERLWNYLNQISPESSIEALRSSASARQTLETVPTQMAKTAKTAMNDLLSEKTLSPGQVQVLEAIIIPGERPVIDIKNDQFLHVPEPFLDLNDPPYSDKINAVIPSIGRIDLPDHPAPYAGTGFLVGPGLLMTNRHVAEIFTMGLGRKDLRFRSDGRVEVDFRRETTDQERDDFRISKVLMIHPYWDMALLSIDGPVAQRRPLMLSVEAPENLLDRKIAVIGYPAFDHRNNVDVQREVFKNRFSVKRMQPGLLRTRADLLSFGKTVSTITHDSSTLGGNSGSAVIDASTGKVVALHFAGIYLKENYGVSAADLAKDPRIVDTGILFDKCGLTAEGPWDPFWASADPVVESDTVVDVQSTSSPQIPPMDSGATTWTIPLHVTVQVGSPTTAHVPQATGTDTSAPVTTDIVEKLVLVDENYANRQGYQEDFLGLTVPLPTITDLTVASTIACNQPIIPYEHYSLTMHKHRRLAMFIAGNIDRRPESKEPEPGRDYSRTGLNGFTSKSSETWHLDPRIPPMHQLPDRFFTKDNKAFDKGHIFRREATTWGVDYAEVQRANGDTFHVTNCSPQVKGFNRSNLGGVWGDLENEIGRADDEKLIVFAGPVLAEDDRFFTGVDNDGVVNIQIPSRYWKIVIVRNGDHLESFAFILEQDLSSVPLEFQVDTEWREHTISVSELNIKLPYLKFPSAILDSDQFED